MEKNIKDKEFGKQVIEIGDLIPCEDSVALAEGDVIVPDIKPDIERIVSVDATSSVKKCDSQGGVLKISGVIFVNMLYLPECLDGEKQKLCSINTKFDFADEIKIRKAENPMVTVQSFIRHIDYSLLNSRKFNLKVYVGLCPSISQKSKIEFLDNNDEEGTLEVKKNKVGIYNVIGDVKKEIIVSENIEIPQSKGDIGEVLKFEAFSYGGECKTMEDKILVKGNLGISMLYITKDSDEELTSLQAEIPFSEVFTVDGLTEDSLCEVKLLIRDYYFNIKDDINGNPRIVSVEALVDVIIHAGEILDTSVTEDCYIPGMCSKAEKKRVSANEVLAFESGRINLKEHIMCENAMLSDVYMTTAKPVITEQSVEDGVGLLKGIVALCIIGKTSDESCVFETREIPFEYSVGVKNECENCYIESYAFIVNKNHSLSSGGADVSISLGINTKAIMPVSFDTVVSCEVLDEESEPSSNLVIYFVQNGDVLWDIAKKYKTTSKKICLANNLSDENEINAGMKLLIPTI